MKRKAISLVLAMLIILASFPLTAFAADGDLTIKSVELTATKALMENYSGWKEKDENGEYFYYDVEKTQPTTLITFSDGSTTTIEWEDFWISFDSFDQSIEQGSGSKQLVAGQTYTADITLDCSDFDAYGIETTLTFEIEENPVSSFSVVATKPLVEGISGDWEKYYDENDEVIDTWFEYDIAKTDYVITVNYKDGTSISGNYFEILDETGYSLVSTFDQRNEPFVLGDNTIEVYYLGVEAEFTFTIIEDPVESIAFNATKTLVSEVNGYWDYIDYDDESKGKWFCYYVSDSEPQITVKYKNGEEVTCASYDCYEMFGEEFSWTDNQSSENPLAIGKHTIKAEFLGHECDYEFEIVQNPIKSISVNVAEKLEENKDGWWNDIYDESGENIIGEYFFYDLDYETTTVTINYTDTTKASETYTMNEISEREDFVFEINLNQSSETPLVPGKYTTGKAKLNGISCTFAFEILENPVKSISAKATKDLVENENGYLNGEDYGEPYFHYSVSDTEPEITVTYKDGTVEKYSYHEICNLGEDFSISVNQSSSNPLKPGTNTATVEFLGRKCEYTFKILEDPIKSVVITPTKDLVENTNGYMTEDSGTTYFYYYLKDLMPTVTINYKDGTQKVYDYITLMRYTDMELYLGVYQEPGTFKLGENTTTATLGGRKIEYKFNIVKQNASQKVKSLVVTPEQKLIENHGGWFNTDYDYETDTISPEYYYYTSEYLTFTATVTFEDGTTKTYKNLDAFDEIEGSDFDVWITQSYENRFKVGKNTVTANYRNATCEFQIEVVENDYTAVSISGENDLTITLTKADGTKENYKVEDIGVAGGGEGEIGGIVRTDSGKIFDVLFACTLSEDTNTYNNVQAKLFYDSEEDAVLKSNVLASNKWMYLVFSNSEINQYAAIYADGYSERYFGREFKGFNGTIKGATVDDILTISTGSSDYRRYENNGVDDKGPFAILTLEEARKLAGTYFDISKIDFTTSPMYNAGPKEIKVYFINGYDGELDNKKLVYANDKFSYSSDYISDYTGDSYPVSVVLDANGNVTSISYVKGACGNVKTVNAKNAEGGVNVTFTAAENATEYEIYRDYNNKGFEKIGTTTELSYLDKTAASGKTYTYKVLPKNATSKGAMSSGKTVTYLAMPVTTATISKTGFTVKWTKVEGTSTYRVYRAEYANGKWSNWEVLSNQKASVSSFADKTVKAGGVYKYTVRALNSDGISGYKGTETIVYLTTPTVKIANASNGVKGTFNQVAGATGYIVYRREYNASTKQWSGWTNLGTAKGTAKSFTDKTAVSGKTYSYTVRAINGNSKSLYTASNTLLYLAQPTVKIANAKAGITVKWTKSTGTKGYTVYRSEYNASTKKWTSWKNMGTTKASASSWTDKSIKAGVNYKYTVRAVNGEFKSTYTASASLVRLAQPTVKIANAKAGITVKWNKITGAKGYTVYRSELANGKWSSWKNMGTTKATASSWTDKSAVSGTTYRYTVRAVNGKSLSSYVATSQLMFLSEPTVKIANAATGVKVSWNKVEGATGYTVYRSEYNASTKKWSKWSNRGTAKADKSSWTDKKVTSGVQYKYTVRAINGNFKSTYTSSGALLYLAQPTVTATKATSGVAVKWNKIAGAKSYIVYRQEKVDGEWTKWNALGTAKASAKSFTDKTAESGKEYRYTVRAVNGKVKSTYKASNTVKG